MYLALYQFTKCSNFLKKYIYFFDKTKQILCLQVRHSITQLTSTTQQTHIVLAYQEKLQSYRKFIVQIKASCGDLCVPIFLAPYYARQIGQNIAGSLWPVLFKYSSETNMVFFSKLVLTNCKKNYQSSSFREKNRQTCTHISPVHLNLDLESSHLIRHL